MAAQGAIGTDFCDRSTRTIVGTMLWTEYRPVIKIGPKGALGSHEIRPIHSATSFGQSIDLLTGLSSLLRGSKTNYIRMGRIRKVITVLLSRASIHAPNMLKVP